MADAPLTPEQMEALMDKVLGEVDAPTPTPTPKAKQREKVKDALKAGAKQGHGGLGLGAQRQLKVLDEENN